ncbi:transcriptional regulator [Erythrobacter sp.]|uniref:transcriptional regulator n=1 Tax=Erythrobacter sp. TaxID=1042 RepID=UPI001425C3FF|nr:transcriptional regulator [Erythrobacter sp.]QIQ86689.1 MAG: transcriptional regulator [Erythrobacter sp.]
MNAPFRPFAPSLRPVFDSETRRTFAAHYPEKPVKLAHGLAGHHLLEIPALAELAERLPESSVEYNRGDLPVGIDGKPGATGLSITETILSIARANSWAVLKNVEQVPSYAALLHDLLGELAEAIEPKTGPLMDPQAFVFISSPDAVTPYHFDPEHNILLQLAGTKVMTQFPAGDPRFAPDERHEQYHLGGPRELRWDESFMDAAREFPLAPGEAVHVPVMAPHFVRNGPESSISLSITWRSEWSHAESDARCFNGMVRRFGLAPRAPGRWPETSRGKALAWRAYRRLFVKG